MVRGDTAFRHDPKLPPFEGRCNSRRRFRGTRPSVRLRESGDPRPPTEIAFRFVQKAMGFLGRGFPSNAGASPAASQLKSAPGLTSENFGVNLNLDRHSQIPLYCSIQSRGDHILSSAHILHWIYGASLALRGPYYNWHLASVLRPLSNILLMAGVQRRPVRRVLSCQLNTLPLCESRPRTSYT